MARASAGSSERQSKDLPGVLLFLANARAGVDGARLLAWCASHQDGLHDVLGLVRVRYLRLAAEQLLPHRARGISHRYAVLYEFENCDAMFATAGRLHLTHQSEGADVIDPVDARCAGFVLVRDVTEPPTLPATAPERPRGHVPHGSTGTFMAFTRPTSAQGEAEYNEWYDEHHLPETLLLDGVRRGRRYRRIASPSGLIDLAVVDTPYLTYYDLDNVAAVPFDRDVLLPWLDEVGVAHLGPSAYDRSFTQAFVHEDIGVNDMPPAVLP